MTRNEKVAYIKDNLRYCTARQINEIDSVLTRALPGIAKLLNKAMLPSLPLEGLLDNIRSSLNRASDDQIDDIYQIVRSGK